MEEEMKTENGITLRIRGNAKTTTKLEYTKDGTFEISNIPFPLTPEAKVQLESTGSELLSMVFSIIDKEMQSQGYHEPVEK